jgi:hypothetical protein
LRRSSTGLRTSKDPAAGSSSGGTRRMHSGSRSVPTSDHAHAAGPVIWNARSADFELPDLPKSGSWSRPM